MATWTGITEMKQALAALRQRLAQPEGFLSDQIAPLLRETVKENIQSGGRPSYPALEETTLAARKMDDRRPQLPGTIPLAGGALEASYTEEGHPLHVEEVSGNTLTFGSERGRVQEVGGSREYPILPRRARSLRYVGRGPAGIGWQDRQRVQHPPLPARPVLTIPDEAASRFEEAGERYLEM